MKTFQPTNVIVGLTVAKLPPCASTRSFLSSSTRRYNVTVFEAARHVKRHLLACAKRRVIRPGRRARGADGVTARGEAVSSVQTVLNAPDRGPGLAH